MGAWFTTAALGFDRAQMGRFIASFWYTWNEFEKLAGCGTPDDAGTAWERIDSWATSQGYSGSRPNFAPFTKCLYPDTSEGTFPAIDAWDGYVLDDGCANLEANLQRLRDAIDGWLHEYAGLYLAINRTRATADYQVSSGGYTYTWDSGERTCEVMKKTGSNPATFERWATRAAFFSDAWPGYTDWIPLGELMDVNIWAQMQNVLNQFRWLKSTRTTASKSRFWSTDPAIIPYPSAVTAVQRVTLTGTPTTGLFKLDMPTELGGFGFETPMVSNNIAFNATAAQVQTAIQAALSAYTGNTYTCSVSGSAGGPWDVTFTGSAGYQPLSAMGLNTSTLDSGSVSITVLAAGAWGEAPSKGSARYVKAPDGEDSTVKAWNDLERMLATLTVNLSAANADFIVTATRRHGGTPGNSITVELACEANPGTPPPYYVPDQTLSVEVSGTDITVHLATSPGGDIATTANGILNAIAAHAEASMLVTCELAPGNDGSGLAEVFPKTNLAHGYAAIAEAPFLDVTDYDGDADANPNSFARLYLKQSDDSGGSSNITLEIVADGADQTVTPGSTGFYYRDLADTTWTEGSADAYTLSHSITPNGGGGVDIVIHVPAHIYQTSASSGYYYYYRRGCYFEDLRTYLASNADLAAWIYPVLYKYSPVPYFSRVDPWIYTFSQAEFGAQETLKGRPAALLYIGRPQHTVSSGPTPLDRYGAIVSEQTDAPFWLELALMDENVGVAKALFDLEVHYPYLVQNAFNVRYNQKEVEIPGYSLSETNPAHVDLDMSYDVLEGIQHIVPGTDLDLEIQLLDWPTSDLAYLRTDTTGHLVYLQIPSTVDLYLDLDPAITHGES